MTAALSTFHAGRNAASLFGWRALSVSLSIGICASFLTGCATKPRTYKPPSSEKMDAARQRLGADVDKATATAKKVHGHVTAAKSSAEKVSKFSGTIEVKLRELHGRVTAELRPEVEDIQADVAAEKEEETVLTGKLGEALETEKTLNSELNDAQTDKVQLTKEAQTYKDNAQDLADHATAENKARVAAEGKLHWYRWHWWGAWIVFGLGVVACIALAVLKFMGKLAFL